MILSLVILVVLSLLDLVAAVGVRGEFRSVIGTGVAWAAPAVLYAAAAASLAATAWARVHGTAPVMRTLLVVGLTLSVVAPLVYGAVTQQFHASHHVVRLVVVLAAGVIVWRS